MSRQQVWAQQIHPLHQFRKEMRSDSEHIHQYMRGIQDLSRGTHDYRRFKVAQGLGDMRLDEWRTRGIVR